EGLNELRDQLARTDAAAEPRRGRSAHVVARPLPGNASFAEFRDRIKQLDPPPGRLAEESLFHTLTKPAVVDWYRRGAFTAARADSVPVSLPIHFPGLVDVS